MIGFLDPLKAIPTWMAIPPDQESQVQRQATTEQLIREGKVLLWKHLGGIRTCSDPNYVSKVRLNAFISKGYHPSSYKEANLDQLLDYLVDIVNQAFKRFK